MNSEVISGCRITNTEGAYKKDLFPIPKLNEIGNFIFLQMVPLPTHSMHRKTLGVSIG